MRPKRIILPVLTVLCLIVGGINIALAYNELNPASSITGRGTVSFLGPQALLDDFNGGTITNLWNGLTGTFSKSTAATIPDNEKCTATFTNSSMAYGGTGHSLKLDYNVSQAASPSDGKPTFAGYYSTLEGHSGGTTLAGYTAISFYVKGAVGGEFFKIQLKNTSTTLYPFGTTNYYRNTAGVYITDYLDGGVTTDWQKVTIPFDNFANLDSWNSMKEFIIVFENAQSTTNGSPTQGTIYIDNITFETGAINTVRIDHFGHKGKDAAGNDIPGANALGGNIGTAADAGTITFLADATDYYLYKYSLRLNYNVGASDAWVATYLIFGGGQDTDSHPDTNKSGWIAIPHDFSNYNYISLRIKAKSGTENPHAVKIEMNDASGSDYVLAFDITTDWQIYRIPLSNFGNISKASIKQLTFTITRYWVDYYNGNRAGTVYIDSVQFEK